jgi:dTDP-4-dehydrorhamnose 3,5-epimerase
VIDGVKVKQLTVHCDERGRLMEMLRSDEEFFDHFGQVYLTAAYPGVVKAWHYHQKQTDHFVVVSGMAKIVLYDRREDSPTHGEINEFFAGHHNQIIVKIPPLVCHGYKAVGEHEAVIVNIPTELFDYANPDEHRIDPHDNSIPYDWSRHDG